MATSSQQQQLLLRMLESCKSMEELKHIQSFVIKSNPLQTNHLIHSKLLSLCSTTRKSRDIAYAELLRGPPTPSMYNAILRDLSKCPNPNHSMALYAEMLETGLPPGSYTFPPLLKTLAGCRALSEGKLIHCHVIKMGFEDDTYTRNSLTRLYLACGEVGLGRMLFDRFRGRDLVSWTTIISGYAKSGFYEEAVSLFVDMTDRSDIRPDAVIMATVLSACSKLRDLELGRRLHMCIGEHEGAFDVYVGNVLVDMYSKCGDTESAYGVFRSMRSTKNVVTWNAMINGLVQNNKCREAISLFRRMQRREGLEPDSVTLVGVLNSCASLGSLELGEWVRCYMDRGEIGSDGIVGNALVDMYAKCGRIDRAMDVFVKMARRDVYSFTAMIAGYAMHGQGERALGLFSEMSAEGVRPNGATLVGVLSACSHSGLVEAGLEHFGDMASVHRVQPQIEHYGCVVDMLGRAGLLGMALEFIRRMPIEPDALIWVSLLGHCRVHGDLLLCEKITEVLLELEPDVVDAAYVLMSNVYASANRKGEARSMRKAMKKKKKSPGCSLIEVDGIVHEFRAGDESHRPDRNEIYMLVEEVGHLLLSEGCEPSSSTDILEEGC